MKLYICILFIGLLPSLVAQEATTDLPEPSEPPFEVGDIPLESGYTIKREDMPDLNFRLVQSKMRLYFLDEEGKITKPTVPYVTIRFDDRGGRLGTRDYHRLTPLSDDVGLGSPYLLVSPHLYYVTLVLKPEGADEVESYRFRYLPAMDAVETPESK